MISLNTYDAWLQPNGPAALVMRQWLMPAEGRDAVIYPPTYAADKKVERSTPYNIDTLKDGYNVCVMDSVPSQANRIEPLFATLAGGKLVPVVEITVKDDLRVNLLKVGHRIADALLKGCELRADIEKFLLAHHAGNAEPIARLAPTSLLFGVWDSRGTGEKIARLFSAAIRAYDVEELTRLAQYFPPINYSNEGLLPAEIDGKPSDHGLVEVPSGRAHGGILVRGEIRREMMLNLVSLRALAAATPEATLKLRRYILGLALAAFSAPVDFNLRQGCLLVLDPDHAPECSVVHYSGKRETHVIDADAALQFALDAAQDFGIDPTAREIRFDPKRLEAKLKEKKDKADKKAKGKSAKSDPVATTEA